MEEKEILKQMFIMQQQLNDETNGVGWENGYTKNDKLINWKRCIYMECAEMIDSFSWKHWKNINQEANWDNAKVETVDIWHFIMSFMIEHYHIKHLGDISKMIDDISELKTFKLYCKSPSFNETKNDLEIVNDIEKLIHLTSGFENDILEKLLNQYFKLSLKCAVNLHELHKLYMAKNVLNKFRQNHGYKDGKYLKIWNGKEDNEVILELLKQKIVNIDEIYENLEKIYKDCK